MGCFHRSMAASDCEMTNGQVGSAAVPPAGLEPATFGLEVQRAIHCAKGANVQATPTCGGPKKYGQPGSNRRSHACEACVLTTRRCPQLLSNPQREVRMHLNGHLSYIVLRHKHSGWYAADARVAARFKSEKASQCCRCIGRPPLGTQPNQCAPVA